MAEAALRPPGIMAAPLGSEADIAREIGQQVEMMILNAKTQSEAKVGKEVQRVKVMMEKMGEKIKLITERVKKLEGSSQGMAKADLLKSITKLEEVWEGEVGTLKHELWQTIQAHNHNADLLKHHKDAIDQVADRIAEAAPNAELEQVHAQLMQVDKVMQREQAKEQQMDELVQRLTAIQQQLAGGAAPAWAAAAAAAGAMPGFAGMQQAAAAVAAAGLAAAAGRKGGGKQDPHAAGKKAPKASAKKASAKATPATLQANANAASLRAEAPEFVPTFSVEAS